MGQATCESPSSQAWPGSRKFDRAQLLQIIQAQTNQQPLVYMDETGFSRI